MLTSNLRHNEVKYNDWHSEAQELIKLVILIEMQRAFGQFGRTQFIHSYSLPNLNALY